MEKKGYYFTLSRKDILAADILRHYGYEVMLAFSIVTGASRVAPPILMSVGDWNDPLMRRFMEKYEESGDYYAAVEEVAEESNMIVVIMHDFHEVGIALGRLADKTNGKPRPKGGEEVSEFLLLNSLIFPTAGSSLSSRTSRLCT